MDSEHKCLSTDGADAGGFNGFSAEDVIESSEALQRRRRRLSNLDAVAAAASAAAVKLHQQLGQENQQQHPQHDDDIAGATAADSDTNSSTSSSSSSSGSSNSSISGMETAEINTTSSGVVESDDKRGDSSNDNSNRRKRLRVMSTTSESDERTDVTTSECNVKNCDDQLKCTDDAQSKECFAKDTGPPKAAINGVLFSDDDDCESHKSDDNDDSFENNNKVVATIQKQIKMQETKKEAVVSGGFKTEATDLSSLCSEDSDVHDTSSDKEEPLLVNSDDSLNNNHKNTKTAMVLKEKDKSIMKKETGSDAVVTKEEDSKKVSSNAQQSTVTSVESSKIISSTTVSSATVSTPCSQQLINTSSSSVTTGLTPPVTTSAKFSHAAYVINHIKTNSCSNSIASLDGDEVLPVSSSAIATTTDSLMATTTPVQPSPSFSIDPDWPAPIMDISDDFTPVADEAATSDAGNVSLAQVVTTAASTVVTASSGIGNASAALAVTTAASTVGIASADPSTKSSGEGDCDSKTTSALHASSAAAGIFELSRAIVTQAAEVKTSDDVFNSRPCSRNDDIGDTCESDINNSCQKPVAAAVSSSVTNWSLANSISSSHFTYSTAITSAKSIANYNIGGHCNLSSSSNIVNATNNTFKNSSMGFTHGNSESGHNLSSNEYSINSTLYSSSHHLSQYPNSAFTRYPTNSICHNDNKYYTSLSHDNQINSNSVISSNNQFSNNTAYYCTTTTNHQYPFPDQLANNHYWSGDNLCISSSYCTSNRVSDAKNSATTPVWARADQQLTAGAKEDDMDSEATRATDEEAAEVRHVLSLTAN